VDSTYGVVALQPLKHGGDCAWKSWFCKGAVELLAVNWARIPCGTSSETGMDPREPSRSMLNSIAVAEKACDGAGVPVKMLGGLGKQTRWAESTSC
jgi:hypothetical protein